MLRRGDAVAAAAAAVASFFFVFFAAVVGGQRLSSQSDLDGLYSLRASLGLRARDWPRRSDPCVAWVGVTCDPASGRVVGLNISGLRRTRIGRLSPRFSVDGLRNLTRLRAFNATGFALPGTIPDWFGRQLPQTFSVLDLRSAAVVGPIPPSLGGASALVVLSLAGNAINGSIPQTLGMLGNLSVLDLSRNELSGAVPAWLSTLANLSRLDLSSNFLSGPLPIAIGTLPRLQNLNLSRNNITGPVPPQLGDLASLLALDLSSNLLQGVLPDDLGNLRNLQNLNLANNALSGNLTDSLFSGLSQLHSINLGHNNFTGALPNALWSLPQLQFLDVSSNNLTGVLPDLTPETNAGGLVLDLSNNFYYGSIPAGFVVLFSGFNSVDIHGNYFQGTLQANSGIKNVSFDLNCFRNATNQRSPIDCEEFYSSVGLPYDGPLSPQPATPSNTPKKRHRSLKYILIGAIGGTLLLIVLAVLLFCCWRRYRGREPAQRKTSSASAPSGVGVQIGSPTLSAVGQGFSFEQLVRATADFSDTNLISHGHSGDIYRGTLEDGVPVVIKRMDMRKVRKDAHMAELDLFSRGLHSRLVPFLGHCLEREEEKFLVYKYVPNGDLSAALQRKPGQEEDGLQSLDWIKRLKIATGVAEALCYLHHECSPSLVHRDVQARSILLDHKFEVRLGSLSDISVQEEGHQNVITRLLRLSQASEQGVSGPPSACAYDTYCFGKVLLELVTGKLGISGSSDAATNEWLEQTLLCINVYDKDLVTRIIDPSLVVDEDHLEEVWAMSIVARSCLNPKSSRRPPMRYILKALENPLKVVREDNSAGSARLRATSSRGSWNGAFFGSWRQSSSDITSVPGQPRDDQTLKHSGTIRSQGSGGEHSFSYKRPSKEIFPEPSGVQDVED